MFFFNLPSSKGVPSGLQTEEMGQHVRLHKTLGMTARNKAKITGQSAADLRITVIQK